MPPPSRTVATVLAQIAEVRRHLHEAPPHHGGGSDALERRLAQLETELAGLRSVAPPNVRTDEAATTEQPAGDHHGDASPQR